MIKYIFIMISALCLGIVNHSGFEPTDVSVFPPSGVTGSWNGNASCVVISRNIILTTIHQGGGVGSKVVFNGDCSDVYSIAAEYKHPFADIRLALLNYANLPDWVMPYVGNKEVGMTISFMGYGYGAGDTLLTDSWPYGYNWNSVRSLRYGTNKIKRVSVIYLISYFDSPLDTLYESALAVGDSGSGWFYYDGEGWYVVALSNEVEHMGFSLFRSNIDPAIPDPDYMQAVRVSLYSDWIQSIMNLWECIFIPGDLDNTCQLDLNDVAVMMNKWLDDCSSLNHYCEGADFNKDNKVDFKDYAVLINYIGY